MDSTASVMRVRGNQVEMEMDSSPMEDANGADSFVRVDLERSDSRPMTDEVDHVSSRVMAFDNQQGDEDGQDFEAAQRGYGRH